MKFSLAIFALALSLCPLSRARAAEPPSAPLLRIETGMHTAHVARVATDAQNRFAVTASTDKTVRVWDLKTGVLLRTLRLPVGAEIEGQIYALAISPDGNTIACGGATGLAWDDSASLYLFDRESGRLQRRIGGLSDGVNSAAFSRDGARLAIGMASEGVRVYRVFDGTLLGQDDDYEANCMGVDFAADGRLVTISMDGPVRLYDARMRLLRATPPEAGLSGLEAVFSPDGTKIAVDFVGTAQILVLQSDTLEIAYAPNARDMATLPFNAPALAWSKDGRTLWSGGITAVADGKSWSEWVALPEAQLKQVNSLKLDTIIRRWDDGGRGAYRDFDASTTGRLTQLQPLQNGGILWSSDATAWGTLSAQGAVNFAVKSNNADFRLAKLGVADDGATVDFSYRGVGNSDFQIPTTAGNIDTMTMLSSADTVPGRFNSAERSLQAVGQPKLRELLLPSTREPTLTAPGLNISNWRNDATPKLNGQPLRNVPFNIARSLAIAPDAQSFVIGSDQGLQHFDRAGQETWAQTTPGVAISVNIARNGRVAVAALADGTIRWYRYSDGAELLALFPHADGKRWVLWTPQGFYDCSPDAEDLIGWHVNRGRDQAADFFPASRFRATFYRPDIIGRVLSTLDENEARRLADAATGTPTAPIPIADVVQQQSPPVVRLTAPQGATLQTSETQIALKYALRAPSGEPITGVQIMIDGRPVKTESNLNLKPATSEAEIERAITVDLPARDCEISVLAINRFTFSEPAYLKIERGGARGAPRPDNTPEAAPPPMRKRLWILAVGVNQYDDPSIRDLSYSGADARDFSALMQAQKPGFYAEVNSRVLTDAAATRDSILDGLDWIQKNAGADDMAMIFLSGHGLNATNGYYYLPSDYNHAKLRSTGLAFYEIQNVAPQIKGRVLFFVDTCYAANAAEQANGAYDLNRAINDLSSALNGWIVLSGAQGNQQALERAQWGNGAFTKALLEAFGGSAAAPDGEISLLQLGSVVTKRVLELTDEKQKPVLTAPGFSDFALAKRVALQP